MVRFAGYCGSSCIRTEYESVHHERGLSGHQSHYRYRTDDNYEQLDDLVGISVRVSGLLRVTQAVNPQSYLMA